MKKIPKHDWHLLATIPKARARPIVRSILPRGPLYDLDVEVDYTSPSEIYVRQVTGKFRKNKWHLMKDQWWEVYLTDEQFDKFRQDKYNPLPWKFVGE